MYYCIGGHRKELSVRSGMTQHKEGMDFSPIKLIQTLPQTDKNTHSCYTPILRDSQILKDLQNQHYKFLHNGFELDLIF